MGKVSDLLRFILIEKFELCLFSEVKLISEMLFFIFPSNSCISYMSAEKHFKFIQ